MYLHIKGAGLSDVLLRPQTRTWWSHCHNDTPAKNVNHKCYLLIVALKLKALDPDC